MGSRFLKVRAVGTDVFTLSRAAVGTLGSRTWCVRDWFEPVELRVHGGRASREELLVHFARPPRDAWANVHHYCAMVLPFRSEADIDAWAARHRLPRGRTVPITQLAELAARWYGRHADPDWRKWTLAEAQAIFAGVGLTDDFWRLAGRETAGTERF